MKELKHLVKFEQFEIEFDNTNRLDEEFLGIGKSIADKYKELNKDDVNAVNTLFDEAITNSKMVVANSDAVRKGIKSTLQSLPKETKLQILEQAINDKLSGRIAFSSIGNKYKVWYKSAKDINLKSGFSGGGTGGDPTGGTSGA